MFFFINYLIFKKIKFEKLLSCKFIKIFFIKYKKRYLTICKLVFVLKTKYIKYLIAYFFEITNNKI